MGFLSDIGGMLPAAYAGFQQGADAEVARQKRESDAAYQEELRAREREMAPLAAEAQKSRLQSQIDQSKRNAEIAPKQHELDLKKLEVASELLPGQLDIAKGEQKIALDQMVGKQIQQVMEGAKTEVEVENYLLASAGEAIARGDTGSLNRIFGHMVDAPRVFPGLNGMQAPVKSEVVTAPEGSKDFTGQPISGPAIQLTMPDGTKQFATTKYIASAYQKHLASQNLAGAKIVKPGERWVNADGTVRAEGQPRLSAGGYIDPETGDFVPTRATGGAGSGAGSRSGGKAPPSMESAAASAFEAIYKNSEAKLPAAQIADGQAFTIRAIQQGAETPEDAARIGLDAAMNPDKIAPDLDAKTGLWSGVYRNPSIQGGRPFNLAPRFTTTQDLAKREGGEDILKDAATRLIAAQGEVFAPGRPELHARIQQEFIAAANDADARSRMIKAAEQDGPEAVASLVRKLELIKSYGPKIKQPTKNADKKSSSWSLSGALGMTPSAGYVPQTEYDWGRPNLASVFGIGGRPSAPARQDGPQEAARGDGSPRALGDDFESDAAKAALARRVKEADAGGEPLSRVERLRAQQLRIIK